MQDQLCGVDPGVGGYRCLQPVSDYVLLPLIVNKKEGAVLDDRPPEGEAVVLVTQLVGRAYGCERGRLGKELVAVEVVGRSMKVVRAGSERDVHHRSGIAAEIAAPGGLLVELVNGLDRQEDTRDARDAPLVHALGVVPEVVVVGAVNLPVVLVGAVAVHRTALVVAGGQIKQRPEVPPIERNLLHRALIHHCVQGAARRLQRGRRGQHLDRFALSSHAERYGQVGYLADGHLDLFELVALKARIADGDRVVAHGEIREREIAIAGGRLAAGEPGALIDDLHGCAEDGSAAGIADAP